MYSKVIFLILFCSFALFGGESNVSNQELNEYKLLIVGLKHLDKEDMAKTLGVKENSFFNFWGSENSISEEFIKNIKTTLKGYLESKGYFDAKYTIEKNKKSVTITIKEGEPVRVTAVSLDLDIDLNQTVTWQKNDIFAAERFVDIKNAIATKLLEEGYCKSELLAKAYVDLKRHSAKLEYKVKRGPLCYFSQAQIKSKPDDVTKEVILSRVRYHEGERFDIHKIEESYNALSSLGTFSNIQIKDNLTDINTTRVNTQLYLDKKKKLRRYMLSIGYESNVGLRAKGSWQKSNFLGNAKRVKIDTQLSSRKQSLEGTFFIPAFFTINSLYADLYITAGLSKEKRDAYKENKLFLNTYLEYRYGKFTLKKGIGLEILNIQLLQDYPSKIGGNFNLLYPYFSLNYDSRDSKIDPKNGLYANLYSEFGVANRADAVTYFKYLIELRAIKTWSELTLSAVGKFGAIHELSGHLPASKLFYGGGLFSNRAYSRDEIGYINSNRNFSQLGGKSFINLQLEANYKLYKKLYGALFFDSTLLSSHEYQFNGKRIDTIGVGLRYKTPVGPIKIDIGFNIHKRKDYAISIMLGQSF